MSTPIDRQHSVSRTVDADSDVFSSRNERPIHNRSTPCSSHRSSNIDDSASRAVQQEQRVEGEQASDQVLIPQAEATRSERPPRHARRDVPVTVADVGQRVRAACAVAAACALWPHSPRSHHFRPPPLESRHRLWLHLPCYLLSLVSVRRSLYSSV